MTLTVGEPLVEEAEVGATLHPFLASLMGRIDLEPTFATEKGLLYSFSEPEPEFDPKHQTTVKSSVLEVSIKPETVTEREIIHTKGVNKHSGKIYQNWKITRSFTFSFKAVKHGHRVLRAYHYTAPTRKFKGSFVNATADLTANLSYSLRHFHPDFKTMGTFTEDYYNSPSQVGYRELFDIKRHARELSHDLLAWVVHQLLKELDPTHPALKMPETLKVAAYPVLQLFPNSKELNPVRMKACLPKRFSLQQEPDVKKFITAAFGPEGVRKDMIKAVVGSTDINAIFLAAQLKHLFPVDWLRDVIKRPLAYSIYRPECYTEELTQPLVEFLGSLTLPKRKRLLLERTTIEKSSRGRSRVIRMDVKDSVRMFFQLNPEQRAEYGHRIDYSSWTRLHDTLTEVSREIRLKEEAAALGQGFNHEGTYMSALDGASYQLDGDTYTLEAPCNGYDLEAWGNEMHNCIGSYRRQVANHGTNVFALRRSDGTLFANIEVEPDGTVFQFMEKYNRPASLEHVTALEALIAEATATKKEPVASVTA